MALSETDRAWLRDEVGESPDDDVLDEYDAELGNRILVAIRVLKRRRSGIVGGANVDSFSLAGVFSVSTKGDVRSLDADIARLEALYAAETGEHVDDGAATVGHVYRGDVGSIYTSRR